MILFDARFEHVASSIHTCRARMWDMAHMEMIYKIKASGSLQGLSKSSPRQCIVHMHMSCLRLAACTVHVLKALLPINSFLIMVHHSVVN